MIELPEITSGTPITGTVQIGLSNLIFQLAAGTSSPGCFHLEDTYFNVILDTSDLD